VPLNRSSAPAASEERYRALVEHSPEATFVVRDGLIQYVNPAAMRLFGAASVDELIGTDILHRVHPDDHALALARRRRVLELNLPAPLVEMRLLTLDGRIIEVEVQATAIEFDGHRATYAAARDISARKQLEDQVRQAQKLEAVGRLAGGVAHDFNNTLAVILGHTEFALSELPADHPMLADLQAIQRAAQHSAALTRQLLTYARRQTIAPQPLDVSHSVTDALRMLRPLIGESIALRWEPVGDLWPITLDPSQFDQILTNLCANARDAIAGVGTLRISASNATLSSADCAGIADAVPGDFVRLTVEDSGRGMSADVLQRAFEPFFTTKGIGEGTGLGLATVYGIVRQNEGCITVTSAPEKGTRFDLYFPRRTEAVAAPAPVSAVSTARRGSETVLVVEDEPEILRLATRALRAKGYAVLGAAGPDDALRIAREHPSTIDLLLTDVMMPVMTGPDLARAIAAIRGPIRLLFMSGYSAEHIAKQGNIGTETAFLAKPFTLLELTSRVRTMLDEAPQLSRSA
jgi:two-component system cell cycle sensor histidine kinase/response regulator CckA